MEKINHFSHEEHPLILKELKAAGDSAAAASTVVCYGCQQPILTGSTTYCCIECDDVFLHKSCAELPLEINHPMHPEHPLQLLEKPPYQLKSCECDICGRGWEYFTYHCSKCDFDVDVNCAKLEIFKHTIDGNHPLILIKELQQDMITMVSNSSEKAIVCYICEEELLVSAGSSSSTYFCSICEVFTHKSCGELPYEIMHPMHNSACHHMLKLSARLCGDLTCNICNRRSVKNCAGYLCSKCEFVVDVNCAKVEIFKHTIDGKHPLILVKELQPEMMMMVMSSSSEKVIVCCNCEEELLLSAGSSSSTYFCSICQVFVHKSCGELPSEIMHPIHNSACHHPLQLFLSNRGSATCTMCDKTFKGSPAYCCRRCEFYLDVLCAQDDGKILQHPGHKHPLKLQQKSVFFKCHACGIEDKDESYGCTECSFWIHKSCGSLPNDSYKCPAPHLETLAIAYCFPEKDRPYEDLKCDICKEKFYTYYWLLYCGPCRYYVHIKCIKSKSPEDEAAKANSASEIPPNWISLPADVLSLQLIQHYLKENGLSAVLIEQSTKIDHFSHRHPLILTNIQDDYSEMDDDDQETVCSGCVEPISGSCYACAQCNYFLHLHCAQLPNNLSSSYHPQHQLSLNQFHEEFFNYFRCSCCYKTCNGFFYECKEKKCRIQLDINCALLPSATKHEAHDHFLFRDDHSNKFCNACNTEKIDLFFSCKTCDEYSLCIECTTFPRTIRHRWDKHPLTLSFPPFYYHPAEFICDFCEKEVHPKYWLYHCRECDNSFHLRCIHKHSKTKFGGKLQIDDGYHPHPLTFLREVKYKFRCDKCGQNLEGWEGFGCEACYFYLCFWCAKEIVDTSPKELN